MKRPILVLAMLLLLPIGSVSAHSIEQANGLTGILHTEPDDDPVAGKPAHLEFFMSSTLGSFRAANCDCHLTVSKDGRAIAQPKLSHNGSTLYADNIFPNPGIYTAQLSGTGFALTFHIEVVADSSWFTAQSTQVLAMSLASLVALGVIARRQIIGGKRYAPKSK